MKNLVGFPTLRGVSMRLPHSLRDRRVVGLAPRALFVMRFVMSCLTGVAMTVLAPAAQAKDKQPVETDPLKTAKELLARPARPARPALPPSVLPLEFMDGERIALVGNSTAERMNLFGHFEALLHQRFPGKKLVVRNFARPADEVAFRQRPAEYTRLDDPLAAFGADTMLLFFGFNESFAGPVGVEKFTADYGRLLGELAKQYPRDDTEAAPRFVIVSPIAVEASGDRLLPDADAQNATLALYRDAARAVAAARGIAFVDLFDTTRVAFAADPGLQHTINGCHVNEVGDRVVGAALDAALFGGPAAKPLSAEAFDKLRAAVNDKSWVHMQDYRMVNGWYVYGGRRTWDTETFPREYVKLRAMAAVRDARVWDIASGRPVPPVPDDSQTGDVFLPQTRFGEPRQAYSENPEGGPVILPPEKLIETCTVPEGFEIRLFADEIRFPEIANPVQMAFDSKGRLWVSTMPSYPQWRPGDPRPADKLVILEDTDGDGQADTSIIFYDKLHCPTGFQFFNGGVLVMDQPRMLWLADTDGDDKADVVVHVLDGWATEDTHHTVGAFEMSPGGLLHMLEGVAMSTAVETPWGPFRNLGTSGCYVLDPRTWNIRHFKTPGYGNPWCYVFNEWGQGICGDGTGANQHWDTPLSGAQYVGRKGLNPVFDNERLRPVVGSEYLRTRQFPADMQDQFIYACVINTNGMPRWTIADDGAGYKGTRVRRDPADPATAIDLLKSTDKHFRPVDPQVGPDGALWFGDWANPLIGHMQYSQRDPNRDTKHGRIYRLVYAKQPLLAPETQAGKPTAAVLAQLESPEWRTRYRARAELQARPPDEVLAAAAVWSVANAARTDLEPAVRDRLALEQLWLQQSFHAIDESLLQRLLRAATPDARAAATRVLADARERVSGAEGLLIAQAADAHPRVRTEAVRGLSFFPTETALAAVVAAANVEPTDRFVAYTADAALGAHINVWKPLWELGGFAARGTPAAAILESVLGLDKKSAEIRPHLAVLLAEQPHSAEERNKALQAIADIPGGHPANGRLVFERVCLNCHKVGGQGADLGPDMTLVASRLAPLKLVESIIDPNADVDEKYLSTAILTDDGRNITGLLVSETPQEVVIFDGKARQTIPVARIDERAKLKQSSMPEGLAATLSPTEFLDLVEFLKSLK
jgi:putative heme-binding domain-containing protein